MRFKQFITIFLVLCFTGISAHAQENGKKEKEIRVEVKVEEEGNRKKVVILKKEDGKELKEVFFVDDLSELDGLIEDEIDLELNDVEGEKRIVLIETDKPIQKKRVIQVEEEVIYSDGEEEGIKLEFEFKTMEELTAYKWAALQKLTDGLDADLPVSIRISTNGLDSKKIELQFKDKVEAMPKLIKQIQNTVDFLED